GMQTGRAGVRSQRVHMTELRLEEQHVLKEAPRPAEKHAPRVSIGLPVYNGEAFLEQALASVLNQTFAEFEVVISDNASTDSTPDICRRLAEADERICYHRNDHNIGLIKNFNQVVRLSRGEYFQWMADDDILDPDYIASCVRELDRDPEVFLVYSRSRVIDELGEECDRHQIFLKSQSGQPHERFEEAVHKIWVERGLLTLQYGLMRRSKLLQTGLFPNYPASDRVFMAELALKGRLFEIPETLFSRRVHPQRFTQQHRRVEDLAAALDPALGRKVLLPHWRYLTEYVRGILRTDLPMAEKARCAAVLMSQYVPRVYRPLAGELKKFVVISSKNLLKKRGR
ncbi:MAG: glycosyltransferase, partial [Rhodothermales bacterium]|nr:glycosyltransferase [Rhodothermales bacterium]